MHGPRTAREAAASWPSGSVVASAAAAPAGGAVAPLGVVAAAAVARSTSRWRSAPWGTPGQPTARPRGPAGASVEELQHELIRA